jgi:hypothetical protein
MQRLHLHAAAAVLVGAMIVIGAFGSARGQEQGALPVPVQFPSADGSTTLTGFVYTPKDKRAERAPAVVMMHGRAGPYSTNVKNGGPYNASTLSKRHKMWGESWSALGYVAVLVDSFGPRGYPGGFGRHTYNDRPDVVNEVTVRPLDAYGALTYLRSRSDVAADRVVLRWYFMRAAACTGTLTHKAIAPMRPCSSSTARPTRRPRRECARSLSIAAVHSAATSRSSFIPAPATASTIPVDRRYQQTAPQPPTPVPTPKPCLSASSTSRAERYSGETILKHSRTSSRNVGPL